MRKDTGSALDGFIGDWDKSSQSQSFRVPDGDYVCNLSGATIEITARTAYADYLWITQSPLQGRQIRQRFFLSSKNDDGVNFGVGQLLDETDALFMAIEHGQVDRDGIKEGGGAALNALVEEVNNLRPEGVIVKALMPKKGQYQNYYIQGNANSSIENGSGYNPGDEVSYEGKPATIDQVLEDGDLVLKQGRKSVTVSPDALD